MVGTCMEHENTRAISTPRNAHYAYGKITPEYKAKIHSTEESNLNGAL